MDSRQINAPERVARTRGQLVDGLRYVWRTPTLATPLVMVAVAGAFAWEFPIALPLMAHGAFGGDAGTYGWMTAAMGVGAVSAGVLGASRRRIRPVSLSRSSVLWRLAIGLACTAPNLPLELVALVLVGYGGISFNAMAKTVLQLAAEPQMRGQIMAIWSVAWGGTSPLGGRWSARSGKLPDLAGHWRSAAVRQCLPGSRPTASSRRRRSTWPKPPTWRCSPRSPPRHSAADDVVVAELTADETALGPTPDEA